MTEFVVGYLLGGMVMLINCLICYFEVEDEE